MPDSTQTSVRRGVSLLDDRLGRFIAALAPLASPARRRCANGLVTLRPDGVPWHMRPLPQRVVAVGDIQGDLVGLASILHDRDLIDKNGRWIGGPAHLVLNGDLVGGHADSRLVMDFVIRLESEAASARGAVHALLGNHDILMVARRDGRRYRSDRKLFDEYPVVGSQGSAYEDAFRGQTAYAKWLRRRNAIIKIGSTLFAHAGVNKWLLNHHPRRVNATIRAWIRYWQGVGRRPDPRSRWTVGELGTAPEIETGYAASSTPAFNPSDTGPLWTRAFKPVTNKKSKYIGKRPAGAPEKTQLREILDRYKAARLVIGHNPVNGGEVMLAHPYHGDMVALIDTRISAGKSGGLACVEIYGDELHPYSTKRSGMGRRVRRLALRRLKGNAVGQ